MERKGHAVAETVGEEELGGGVDEIVLPDPERPDAVVHGGRDEVPVQMHRALRRAGRAGGVEPERNVVAGGGRRIELWRRSREQCRELVTSGSVRTCGDFPGVVRAGSFHGLVGAVRVTARDDHLIEVGLIREGGRKAVEQRGAHHRDARPRIPQQVSIVVRSQQGVDGNRHAAGLDRAPEHGREVDPVEDAHQHSGLELRAQGTQRVACAVHPLGQLAVGVAARVVDEGGLSGPSSREVGVDEFDRGVVVPRQLDRRRRIGAVHRGESHWVVPPRKPQAFLANDGAGMDGVFIAMTAAPDV